jgi:hypothetical protein
MTLSIGSQCLRTAITCEGLAGELGGLTGFSSTFAGLFFGGQAGRVCICFSGRCRGPCGSGMLLLGFGVFDGLEYEVEREPIEPAL